MYTSALNGINLTCILPIAWEMQNIKPFGMFGMKSLACVVPMKCEIKFHKKY
jgi:hypothetical protein